LEAHRQHKKLVDKTQIDIGIFAYNEAGKIATVIAELTRQTVFATPDLDIRLHVLANGCTDATCALARDALAGNDDWCVHDLHPGGKSLTWNRFVHELSRPKTDILLFCDADIILPNPNTVLGLIRLLLEEPERHATVSRPVKDIVHDGRPLGLTDRLIAQAATTSYNWQHAICGQLYAMRTDIARGFHLPIGLPVEDGFIRAMILTSVLTEDGDVSRIWGESEFFHVYQSERSLRSLIRHQVRIVIGSGINAVVFGALISDPSLTPRELLRQIKDDPDWISRTLRSKLPQAYGYIPLQVLTKRLRRLDRRNGLARNAIIMVGFGFDAVVYVAAQWRMFRGAGAGFW
jgi:glycosyltransferase involved in cell wall biosynthesis